MPAGHRYPNTVVKDFLSLYVPAWSQVQQVPSQSVIGYLIRRTAFHTYRHRGSFQYPAVLYPSMFHILLKHTPAVMGLNGKNPVPYSITL